MDTSRAALSDQQITIEQRELLDQVLDKWSLRILDVLCEGPQRFNGLRREIPDVTQKSLTTALRRLERNGMVERTVVSTRPVAVEYSIAALGKTLQDLIDALLQWTTSNMTAVREARVRFDHELHADNQPITLSTSTVGDPAGAIHTTG